MGGIRSGSWEGTRATHQNGAEGPVQLCGLIKLDKQVDRNGRIGKGTVWRGGTRWLISIQIVTGVGVSWPSLSPPLPNGTSFSHSGCPSSSAEPSLSCYLLALQDTTVSPFGLVSPVSLSINYYSYVTGVPLTRGESPNYTCPLLSFHRLLSSPLPLLSLSSLRHLQAAVVPSRISPFHRKLFFSLNNSVSLPIGVCPSRLFVSPLISSSFQYAAWLLCSQSIDYKSRGKPCDVYLYRPF